MVNDEGCKSVAHCRGHVIDGKGSKGQLPVPVVLVSVGPGAQCITDDTISQLHLGVGVLVVGRADNETEPMLLMKALNTLLVNLGL